MEYNLLEDDDVPDVWGTHDLQCLFCSDKTQNCSEQLMTAEVVESIPIILNFHPANIPNWNQRLLQTSLCSNCHQITLEGTKLRLQLGDIQRKLIHISATITNIMRKGYFGDSTSRYAINGHDGVGQDQIPVTRLRHDLSRCLQLKPFPGSREEQSYKDDISDDDVNETERDDWHPTLVGVDDHLKEESKSAGEENDALHSQDSGSEFTPETKRNRTVAATFTKDETNLLLKLYKEKSEDLEVARGKKNCRAVVRSIWNEIARKVSVVANIERKWQQCRTKIKNCRYVPSVEDHVTGDDVGDPATLEAEIHEILPSSPDPNLLQNFNNNVVVTSNGCFTLKTFQVKLQRCDEKSFLRMSPPLKAVVQQHRRINLKQRLHRLRQLATVGDKLNRRKAYCPIKKKRSRSRPQHFNRTNQPAPPQHSCPVTECNQAFVGVVCLERHISDKHGGEFEHFCELCGKGFFTPIGLQTHKARYHGESVLKFGCDLCPAKFIKQSYLSNHKVRMHEGANSKTFLCEVCSVGFKEKPQLQDHQGKVHGDLDAEKFKPERQTCTTCGYVCANRGYLRRHMIQHGAGQERKYPCTFPNCTQRFDRPSNLKTHLARVHSEERNFQCHLCPKAYKDVQRLNYHLRRHEGVTASKCPHCPKSLANAKSLKSHIKVIHESNLSIKCEDCGEGFPIRKYYLRHRLICAQGFSGTGKKSTPKHVEARRRREGYI